MLVSSLLASTALVASVYGTPVKRGFYVPTNDGFPSPGTAQVADISGQAGGKIPGGALPKSIGPNTMTAFQLITFNELFETSYFSSLLNNVTYGVPGYESDEKDALVTVLQTVLAQEELHALAGTAALQTAGAFAPTGCQYQFPVTNLQDAVSLAETFTAVVLGALQGANVIFASENQPGYVQIISSVIGQEGAQNGAYRVFLKEVPSESPFLTYVPAAFAWSALQNFVVPGSCPYDLGKVNLPIFPGLQVNGGLAASVEAKDQTLDFTGCLSGSISEKYIGKTDLFITYTTGQQLPVSVPIENVQWDGAYISFSAPFPFTELVAEGLSHAALTINNSYATVDAIVADTVAAPGLIQVAKAIKY